MCGEKLVEQLLSLVGLGSPPHVRGKDFGTEVLYLAARITPACAGKSTGVPILQWEIGDHPRMCGEKATI